jgi:hypothetical protein
MNIHSLTTHMVLKFQTMNLPEKPQPLYNSDQNTAIANM